jgi:uncharacterized integral membrane protein
MWRLIEVVVILAIELIFVMLNLGNTSNVSIGFHTFYYAPVSVIAFVAFILGIVASIPFYILSHFKKKAKLKAKAALAQDGNADPKARALALAEDDSPDAFAFAAADAKTLPTRLDAGDPATFQENAKNQG